MLSRTAMGFPRFDKSLLRIQPGIDHPSRFASCHAREMLPLGCLRPLGVQQVSTLRARERLMILEVDPNDGALPLVTCDY
jgi:hypothetical protein